MNVILAKSAGFCWGVKRAVEQARTLSAKSKVLTDGPLIHNNEMLRKLENENINEAQSFKDINDGVILIRAHGIPPERYEILNSFNLPVEDATCPYVTKIQQTIKKHAENGYEILIYGDEGHAEVTGLMGFSNDKGHVVKTEEDIQKLPDFSKVCLVSQSTQHFALFQQIAEVVRSRFMEAVVVDTICSATKNRQKELISLASQVDVIIVVGGRQSANTLQLVKLAEQSVPTFHIQTAEEIEADKLKKFKTAGLTAGASTPDFIIEAVQKVLEKI